MHSLHSHHTLHSLLSLIHYFSALDQTNRALKYYYADQARKAADAEGERLFNERRNCYSHILKVFDRLKSSNDVLMTSEEQRQEELAADVKNMVRSDGWEGEMGREEGGKDEAELLLAHPEGLRPLEIEQ
jgi:hypothetical protein